MYKINIQSNAIQKSSQEKSEKNLRINRWIIHRYQFIASDWKGYQKYLLSNLIIACSMLIGIILLYQLFWKPHFDLALNRTTSLPQKLFFIIKHASIQRGDFLAFYPPNNPLYGDKTPFLKQVGGISGDHVIEKNQEIYVNGKDMGHVFQRARNGTALHAGPTGVIPNGYYYVYTRNPKSYDSRYQSIGWISKSRVVGRAIPLF